MCLLLPQGSDDTQAKLTEILSREVPGKAACQVPIKSRASVVERIFAVTMTFICLVFQKSN